MSCYGDIAVWNTKKHRNVARTLPEQVIQLVVAHFGPPKIPKCPENGLFWDQKWVKNGSQTHLSKNHPGPFGVHHRVK